MKFIHSQELLDIPEGGKFFPRIPVDLLVGWALRGRMKYRRFGIVREEWRAIKRSEETILT